MPYPSVAVIIINWNGYELTRKCILSLRKIDYPNYSVILVDNGSAGGDAKKAAIEFPEMRILANKTNQGFTGGNNLAMQIALDEDFDYLLLLNNDTEQEADFLNVLMAEIHHRPGVAAVQPRINYLHDRNLVWSLGGIYNRWFVTSRMMVSYASHRGDLAKIYNVDWLTGCCILIKSDVVRQVGLFDDRFFAYCEDVDWSLRIRKRGYDLCCVPTSIIYHVAGASGKQKVKGREGYVSPLIHYLNVRNRIFLIRKHAKYIEMPTIWLLWSVMLLGHIVYFIARGRFQKLKSVISGIRDGITTPLEADTAP